jgi:hypothetical protein
VEIDVGGSVYVELLRSSDLASVPLLPHLIANRRRFRVVDETEALVALTNPFS